MAIKTVKFRVEEKVREKPGVFSLCLEPVTGGRFAFQAGQFIMVSQEINGKVERKAYSISSGMDEKDCVMITFSVHGDFTKALASKNEGDEMEVDGPYGKFVLDESSLKHAVFIAGGIGVTPLYSMIRRIAELGNGRKATLFYTTRNPDHMIFVDKLLGMGMGNFKLVQALTGEEAPEDFSGYRKRIDGDILKENLGDVLGKEYYICGPPPMVEGIVDLLKGLGVPKEDIRHERW